MVPVHPGFPVHLRGQVFIFAPLSVGWCGTVRIGFRHSWGSRERTEARRGYPHYLTPPFWGGRR